MKLMPLKLYYNLHTKEEILEWAKELTPKAPKSRKTNKSSGTTISYYDYVASFDIETTSLYNNENEAIGATMYVWQFGLHGKVCIGRTWDEFKDFFNKISDIMGLDITHRLVIYIHNLSFEFQWLAGQFAMSEVFALDVRKPLRAIMGSGFELRCSYLMSGDSLKEINLIDFDVKKQDGKDFDYTKKRGCVTPLTDDEIKYCIYDCLVVMAYVYECMKYENKNMAHLRMTKTGMVRDYIRKLTIWNKKCGFNYKKMMSELTIESEEYKSLKRAFMGGITHASATKVMKEYNNVESRDITSSYPTVLCSEFFPMKKGKLSNNENFTEEQILGMESKRLSAVMDVEIWGIIPKFHFEHILSESKCWDISGDITVDNGRICMCDHLKTTMTNIDFENISNFYKWEKIKFSNVWIYETNYLPKQILYAILDLYEAKTKLKDISGSEYEYSSNKSMLNSIYGDFVMDIVRDLIEYLEDGWSETITSLSGNLYECLHKYNTNKNRYNYYPWGVFCTAFARRNLCKAILAQGSAYIYADTDSVKCIKEKMNEQFFVDYNKEIEMKITRCLELNNIDVKKAFPKNSKEKVCPLGIWDFDGMYKRFKTLGAKRYIYSCDPKLEEDGSYKNPELVKDGEEWHITVAGLSKHDGAEFLVNKEGDVMEHFSIGLNVDSESSGRLTSYYFDNEIEGEFIDYLGNKCCYKEKKSVCLVPTEFTMKENTVYNAFINMINDIGIISKCF